MKKSFSYTKWDSTLTLLILADEMYQSPELVGRLRAASHDVLTVTEAGLKSKPDAEVFEKAIQENRMVLTKNCADFLRLTRERTHFPGLLLIYSDANPRNDMSYTDIVSSIQNLENSGSELADKAHNLNHWRQAK